MLNIQVVGRQRLVDILKDKIVIINFIKKDGSPRAMNCTLIPELIDTTPSYSTPREYGPLDIITVWDLEAQGWRSVKPETIISVEIVE